MTARLWSACPWANAVPADDSNCIFSALQPVLASLTRNVEVLYEMMVDTDLAAGQKCRLTKDSAKAGDILSQMCQLYRFEPCSI